MRKTTLAGTSVFAILAACSTGASNAGQAPSPGDSTVTTSTMARGRDSAAARNVTDSAGMAVRRTRDSLLNTTRTATDTTAAAARATVESTAESTRSSVQMRSASGRDLGTLTVTEAAQSLSFAGTLRGLPPGTHGVHVHMTGRCDAPEFTTAGEHWNPTSKQHGTENPQGPHLGDMMNITVGADSSANVTLSTRGGTMRGQGMALMDSDGSAIVIHAAADDYRTDPSGNSGARIACGAIAGK